MVLRPSVCRVILLVHGGPESHSFLKFGAEPRKKAHADFYSNYDSMKDFEETRKADIKCKVISECKEFFGLSSIDVHH